MLDTYIISLLDTYRDTIDIVEKEIQRNKARHTTYIINSWNRIELKVQLHIINKLSHIHHWSLLLGNQWFKIHDNVKCRKKCKQCIIDFVFVLLQTAYNGFKFEKGNTEKIWMSRVQQENLQLKQASEDATQRDAFISGFISQRHPN